MSSTISQLAKARNALLQRSGAGAAKAKPQGVSPAPVRKLRAEPAEDLRPYVPPTHSAANELTGAAKQQNLAQLIYQVTAPDALDGVHPNTIARIAAELNTISDAGEYPDLLKALGPDGPQRLARFEQMAADPVMFAHEQNIARRKAFEDALNLAGTTPAPARPRGDADAALAARRTDVDVLDEASPEELMQWFDSLPEGEQLTIAKNSGATSTGVIDKAGMLTMAQQSEAGLDHLRRAIKSALLESPDQGTATLRKEIVDAGRPRMRPQETPQYQPLKVRPGEGVTKLDDERAQALEDELAKQRYAPSMEVYGSAIAPQGSVLAQTGIKKVDNLPLGLRPNTDRSTTPLETRRKGDRLQSRDLDFIKDREKALKDLEAAQELGDPELVAEAQEAAQKFNRSVPYMSDRVLNGNSVQETYDTLVQQMAGHRTKAMHNLARSSESIDPIEAAAGDLASGLGLDDAAEALADHDLVQHGGAPKKSRLGGRVAASRRMGAVDRMFSQKGRVVNPFDIAEFGHSPQDHAKLADRILATSYAKHDPDTDLQRLMNQIGQEVDQYGASPTAIAEQGLRANTFFKPGTAAWDMAREEIARVVTDRFGGRTAKPGSVPAHRVAPIDAAENTVTVTPDKPSEPTVTITPDKAPESTVTVEPDAAAEPTVTITPDQRKGGGSRSKPRYDTERAQADYDAEKDTDPKIGKFRTWFNKNKDRYLLEDEPTVTVTPDTPTVDEPDNVAANLDASAIDLGPESTVTVTPDPAKPASTGSGAFGRGGNGGKGGVPPHGFPPAPAKAAGGNGSNPPPPPKTPAKSSWKRWLIGAGGVIGGGMAVTALNKAFSPTYIDIPGGMGGGTGGEGTFTPDVSSRVSVPAEARSGRDAAMQEQEILDRLSRIRGGTLGRMPMLHTMQEYY